MYTLIKRFFVEKIEIFEELDEKHTEQLAVAALLTEIMLVDERIDTTEQEMLKALLAERFQLDEAAAARLIALAEAELHHSTDYHQFTRLLNNSLDAAEKSHLIEQLWRLALADDRLDKYEEHLVRKLSELLYVPHSEFIRAKHRALSQKG